MIGAARIIPVTVSQVTSCQTPTKMQAMPTMPGKENRLNIGETAIMASTPFLILSETLIKEMATNTYSRHRSAIR